MQRVSILTITLFLILSCSTTHTGPVAKDKLDGAWTMMSWVAFSPSLPQFSAGDIVWDFDSSTNQLTVTKKDIADQQFITPQNGTYPYTTSVSTSEGNVVRSVTFDGATYHYRFNNNQLIIDSNTNPMLSNDLPVMTFDKL